MLPLIPILLGDLRTSIPELLAAFTFFQRTQHGLQVTCAFVIFMICKVSLPTFLDTMGFQEEKWLLTAGALLGTLALETGAVTAWKTEVKSTGMCMAFPGAPGPHSEVALDSSDQYKLVCWAKQQQPRSQGARLPVVTVVPTSWVTELVTPLPWACVLSQEVGVDVLSHPAPWVKIKVNHGKY